MTSSPVLSTARWLLVPLCLALSGCGIETVASLPTPPVADYNLQSDLSRLQFSHSASLYSGLDYFSGYLVYYKISPLTTGAFDTLIADRDTLATTPTVAELSVLGYTQIKDVKPATLASAANPSTATRENLLYQPGGDGEVLSFDFNPVISPSTSTTYVEPTVSIGSSVVGNLFRSPNVAVNAPDQLFSSFENTSYVSQFTSARPADVAAVNTDPLNPNKYQIEFFLVATGLTGNLTPVYSNPAPWGVIRPVGP